MKAMPPSFARAMPICSPDTACMTAETIGTLSCSAGSSPRRKRTSGVFRETFSGMHSLEE